MTELTTSAGSGGSRRGRPKPLRQGGILLALLLVAVWPSHAQRGEIGFAYQYSRMHSFTTGENVNMNGIQLEASYYLHQRLAVSSEISGFFHCVKFCNAYFDFARDSTILALVGPRFVLPSVGGKTPFIHLRAGLADSESTDDITGFRRSSRGLGLAAGGGLDLDYGRWAIRAFQADFLRTHAKGSPQNTFRVGVGASLRIGKLREGERK